MTRSKKLVIWAVIIVSFVFLWELVKMGGPKVRELSYSEFLAQAEAGRLRRVTIAGDEARVVDRDGQTFMVVVPSRQDTLLETLRRQNVEIWFRDVQAKWPYWIFNLAPLLIFGVLLYLMMKQLKEIRRLAEERRPGLGPGQADK